ncbi:MAG: outer membrane protein transport protein [Chlamydiota bacterium]
MRWSPLIANNRLRTAAILLISAFMPAAVSAQAFRNPPQDAKAAGMGNAFVGRADNASAVFYNPAGIAFLDSPLSTTANLSIIDPRYKNETQEFRTKKQQFFIPDGFITTDLFNKYLSFGYGAFSEYGLSSAYPKDTPVAPLGYLGSLKTLDNRFVWALRGPKPFDWASVGGGFDLTYGQTVTKSLLDFGALTTGIPSGQPGGATFRGEGHGFGWNLGAMFKMKKMHSLGISFASHQDINEHGKFKLAGFPPSLSPVPEISFPATSKFVLPMKLTGGYMFQPVDWFKFDADITWLKFSRFKNVSINLDDPTGRFPGQSIAFNFHDSWVYSLGAELGPFKGVSFRSGWCHIQSPVPSAYFNPVIPDADRNVASLGLGYTYKKFSVDLCYAAVAIQPRKINNMVGAPFTSINGRWTGFVNQILMGASYAL